MANAPCKPPEDAAQYKWSMKWHHFGDIYCTCNETMKSYLLKELCRASKAELKEILTKDSDSLTGNRLLARIYRTLKTNGNLYTSWNSWPPGYKLGVRRLPDVFPNQSVDIDGEMVMITAQDLRNEMIITPHAVYIVWPFNEYECDDGRTLEQKIAHYGIDIPVLKAGEYDPTRDLLASQAFNIIDNGILDKDASNAAKKKMKDHQKAYEKDKDKGKRKKNMRKAIKGHGGNIKLPDIDFEGKLDEEVECTMLAATNTKLTLIMGLKDRPRRRAAIVLLSRVWPCGNIDT